MNRMFPALLVVLWSTGFIGARMGMPHAEPFSFLSLRFLLALVLLAGLAALARAPWPGWRLAVHSIIVGFLLHGINLGAVFWTIDRGMPAGVSAMILGLQPITAAVLAGFVLDERLSARHWIGLLIGILGLVLVLAPKLEFGDTGITPLNIALSIFGMLGLTFGTIYQKKFATTAPLRTGAFWQYVGALLPMVLLALVFEDFVFDWNGELIFAFGWLTLVLSIGAVFLLMVLIKDIGIAKVSSLFYLVPASTAVIAWAMFGETLSMLQLTGMVIAAIGVRFAMGGGSAAGANRTV